ncbi:hypothetical protein TNCV_1501401 [Trichonephila clavipes]|uniref:Uncharacterized protein n=1 Tax=Trichonephila clavipes TaxID=2585209 RepID=A0A8X6S0Y8_TRICX|nr:hypothetical protein TNCV_1501401 [Trichonephila clavipes]
MIGPVSDLDSLTNVAEEFGINKRVLSCTWKTSQTKDTAVRNVGGDSIGKQPQWMTDISSCREKSTIPVRKFHCSATRYSNSRGLFWPDTFTKVVYSSAIQSATFLLKLAIAGVI